MLNNLGVDDITDTQFKRCKKCGEQKHISCFHKLKKVCKDCKKEINYLYYRDVYQDVVKARYKPHGKVGRPRKDVSTIETTN